MATALIFDGFPAPGAEREKTLVAVTGELAARGWTWETVALRERKLAPCTGCFSCWLKTPGVCMHRDDGPDLLRRFQAADLVVLVTPVTFGGHSSSTKRLLDRLVPTALPFFTLVEGEVHHVPRYRKNPAWIVVGVLTARAGKTDSGAGKLFRELFRRNTLNNADPRTALAVVRAGAAGEEARAAFAASLEGLFPGKGRRAAR
jgi:multimeric flavodoxin WrbA